MPLPITTERLRLRVYREDDVEQIHAVLYGDPAVRQLTGGVSTVDETQAIIAHYIDLHERLGYSYWAVEERGSGQIVGEAGLKPLDDVGPDVEIGYAFAEACWGRGYATEAAEAIRDEAFGPLGFERIFATAREANAGSRNVLDKLGFTPNSPPGPAHADLRYYVVDRARYVRPG